MLEIILNTPLFYDIPEYLQIVSSHSFWQSITLGHFPIHPVFMAFLWGLIKFLPVNLIAILFGIASVFVLSKISKKATFIYAILPAIWIINTNLMVESILLFFYVLATYFLLKQKNIWFLISIFLMVGVHIEAIFWIPTIFFVPILLKKKIKNIEFIKLAVSGIIFSLLFYLVLYKISGRNFSGSTEQAITYFSSGILRMLRNIWLTFSTGFGSLTIFVLGFLVIKNANKKERIGWTLFGILFCILAANWQGDFMVRRVAYVGIVLSLGLTKYLKKWWWIFVLYLIPITLSNILLYAKGSPFTSPQIPSGQVLIQTHYLAPFTKYDGTVLWIDGSDMETIDDLISSGKRVFLTEDATTAPYRLIVGNNYHITSLFRVGESESRFLFKKYKFSKYNNVYELEKFSGKVSESAGEPVIFYGTDFVSRLSRRRVDYGDLGVWIWAIITNHRDPTGWTYKDVRGVWLQVQNTNP